MIRLRLHAATSAIKSLGTVKMTVTAAETGNYKAASKTVTVKISAASTTYYNAKTVTKTIKKAK